MRYKTTKIDWAMAPLALVVFAGIVYVAFVKLGFLGIGILGLLTGIVAVNVDLEQGVPNANLFGTITPRRDRISRAETAERLADLDRDRLPIFVAKVVSAGMVIIGFGLFFMYQLPS